MNQDRIDRLYAKVLTNHEGWALWRKFTTEDLQPGAFGYFDSDGVWKPIVQITDDDELRSQKWVRLHQEVVVKENTGRTAWGPKVSRAVSERGGGGTIGGPVPHLPGFELSATFEIKNTFDAGAILATEAPIVNRWVVNDGPLHQWLKNNSKEILERHGKELREHGLWIITKTWHTRRSLAVVLTSKSSEITVGLGVDISGFATLTPKSKLSSSSGGTSSTMNEDDDYGVVVFVCGIQVVKKMFTAEEQNDRRESQKFLRGGTQTVLEDHVYTFQAAEQDGSQAELEVAAFPRRSEATS